MQTAASVPESSAMRSIRGRRSWLVPMTGLLGLFAVHAVVPFGGATVDDLFARWVNSVICMAPGIFVMGRAVLVKRERLPWAVIGIGLTLWGTGNVYYLFALH